MKIIDLYSTEKQLIEGVLAQNPKAQKRLYEQFSPLMFAVCKRYFKDHSTAEDLLIEGFLKVFNHLHTFSFQGSFEGWMRRIFIRICLDELRKRKPIVFSNTEVLNAKAIEDTPLEFGVGETMPKLETLLEAVDALQDSYRLVFSMYVLDGYSHKEISGELGISVAASKVQLSRARKMLQMRIDSLKTVHDGKK